MSRRPRQREKDRDATVPAEAPSVPIFIQQGADTLTCVAHERSGEPADEILRGFGPAQDEISPELLRRIKFGLCSEEEMRLLQRIHSKEESEVEPAHVLWSLCATAIETHTWQRQIVKNVFAATVGDCPHLLSGYADDDECDGSLTANDNASLDDVDISLDPTLLHALLLQYGRIQNKLKKLRQLEEDQAKLADGVVHFVRETADFPVQDHLIANVLDGVELIAPSSSSSSSSRNSGNGSLNNKNSGINSSLRLQEELQVMHANTSSIGAFQQNEELFWRWISSCKRDTQQQQQQSLALPEALRPHCEALQSLRPHFTSIGAALCELEGTVLALLMKKKLSAAQLEAVLQSNNAVFEEKIKDCVSIAPCTDTNRAANSNTHTQAQTQIEALLAQLLQLSPRVARTTVDSELTALRDKHRLLLHKLMEDFAPLSPFECVFK